MATQVISRPSAKSEPSQIDAVQNTKAATPHVHSHPPHPPATKLIAVSSLMGFVFGWVMQKGAVYIPKLIINQMLFKDFTMLKFFLTTGATSSLVLSAMWLLGGDKRKRVETAQENYVHGEKGLTVTIVGGLLLGAGMAVGGACPGTVFVQLGTGMAGALYTIFGGLAGTAIYGAIDPYIGKFKQSMFISKEKGSLNALLGVPYPVVAVPIATAMLATVAILEYLFPYAHKGGQFVLDDVTWAPYLTGILLGSLQVPGLLFLGKLVGASSSFTVLVSSTFCSDLLGDCNCNPYFAKSKPTHLATWWQNIYVVAAIAGSAASAYLSHTLRWTWEGTGPVFSFLGGFLILFGARMANGCTSGHGISGFSTLAVKSMITVPAMFAGGIATAFVLSALGVY